MGLPSVSSPFDYLVQQIQTDLDHAADLCEEIRQNRHIGHNPTELNALEKSLREGPSFIRSEEKAARDFPGADLDGWDEIARSEFFTYTREVESICQRLESISHHHRHHHHHHHSNHHNFLFSPPPPPPPPPEKVGFHDMRLKWENSRDGVSQTLAFLKQRLETKKKESPDEEKRKKEEEKDKKDVEEKKHEEKKDAEEKKQMGKEEESTEGKV